MERERGREWGERKNKGAGGKKEAREARTQEREKGPSSLFYSGSGLPGCCQVTVGRNTPGCHQVIVGWSLDRMLTVNFMARLRSPN